MSHTKKYLIERYSRDFDGFGVDAAIYTSGGNQHTVHVEVITDDGCMVWQTKRSFKTGNTRDYARDYIDYLTKPNARLDDICQRDALTKRRY